jgi:hypothetical protein
MGEIFTAELPFAEEDKVSKYQNVQGTYLKRENPMLDLE